MIEEMCMRMWSEASATPAMVEAMAFVYKHFVCESIFERENWEKLRYSHLKEAIVGLVSICLIMKSTEWICGGVFG